MSLPAFSGLFATIIAAAAAAPEEMPTWLHIRVKNDKLHTGFRAPEIISSNWRDATQTFKGKDV